MTALRSIKVYCQIGVYLLLLETAEDKGVSLSQLMLDAAIAQYLTPRRSGPRRRPIAPQSGLESPETPGSKPEGNLSSEEDKPAKAPKKLGQGLGVLREIPQTPAGNLDTALPMHVDNLVVRFGGDRALKARLMQLGGRGRELWEGSLPHARRVAKLTSEKDPDGLSWFPVDETRAMWRVTSVTEWVSARLLQGLEPLPPEP